ncbi:MAG: hypothetical protein JRE40_07620 [Deltaproteobacteria bacterium]|nr:hypothetical protein [Deltaproteobacteria bacterium]
MANQSTLELLVILALERADKLAADPATGDPIPTADIVPNALIYYVNAELSTLWDVLISTYEDYCIKRKAIAVVPDIQEYSMPTDFYKFRKVFPILNSRRHAPLRKFNLRELGEADSFAAILARPIEYTRYRLSGNRLMLHPIPTNTAELELWYVPQYDPILNLQDKIDFRFPAGWEEYAIEGVAARLLEREESDASAQRARQKEILQRILVMAEDRDVGEPHGMQDTENYLDSWGFRNEY